MSFRFFSFSSSLVRPLAGGKKNLEVQFFFFHSPSVSPSSETKNASSPPFATFSGWGSIAAPALNRKRWPLSPQSLSPPPSGEELSLPPPFATGTAEAAAAALSAPPPAPAAAEERHAPPPASVAAAEHCAAERKGLPEAAAKAARPLLPPAAPLLPPEKRATAGAARQRPQAKGSD